MNTKLFSLLLLGAVLAFDCASSATASLEMDWQNPPGDAKLRAYWWWLNGNVTRESITRDLEQMKAKGFGGALICDANGAAQDGNAPVPHGPTFFSPEWRELYKHTLREADRLGLEMSLNIQSGWNLGGPMVKAGDAPKKLTWSELRVTGGTPFNGKLGEPSRRDNFYQDLFVLAYRLKPASAGRQVPPTLTASSAQPGLDAKLAGDGDAATFWVSGGDQPGQGPTPVKPQWLQLDYGGTIFAESLSLLPRDTYGPRECELQASEDGKTFHTITNFSANGSGETKMAFPPSQGRVFRLVITGAFDPKFPQSPRNAQVAELKLIGKSGLALGVVSKRQPLQNQREKALLAALRPFSAPSSAPLFQEFPATPGEEDVVLGVPPSGGSPAEPPKSGTPNLGVIDLTKNLSDDGTLNWNVPAGDWQVIRFGCTLNDNCHVSTCSDGWQGYAIDPFDKGAFTRYWDAVVEPLIADAGSLAGKTLKYLHTDSWEVEVANWTPTLHAEFQKRRGYDLLPWLPVIAGKIVNSRNESDRFLADYRRTIGDLAIDNHYALFKDRAHQHGLLIHPESGGPHAVPIDAQQCLGFDDAPMSEFWAWSWTHRIGDENRFFVKQPASAAHTYGHKLVLAEGFTTIGPHWQETLWDNLKPAFDHACTEGLNLLVWHAFVCSPESAGVPGQQYFAGTHLNPNVTWWEKSAPFFAYINRCQSLLQHGLPAADVAFYYGDHVPNFTQLRRSDPAKLGRGYDYDVITEEALLTRATVKDGRVVLPDGMSYRVLVLPNRTIISLPVLRKLKELLAAGATIIGPKPDEASGLKDFPQSDAEVKMLADELWGHARVITNQTAREFLLAQGVAPDFEQHSTLNSQPTINLDFTHRTADGAEIYFVSSRSNQSVSADCIFRVAGKAPELWNAVTGEHQFAAAYAEKDGRTIVPLDFTPCGSWFVVFRESATKHPATATANSPQFTPLAELTGAWTVKFDPQWGGPASATFDQLVSWSTRTEPGIKFYSGTATYEKTFELPSSAIANRQSPIWLDLGHVRELAEIRVNGKSCGVMWAPPFRVDLTDAVKPGENKLEIEVVNFWPNRIIGDAALLLEQRRTQTNVRKLTKDTKLTESGLFGPVRLLKKINGKHANE